MMMYLTTFLMLSAIVLNIDEQKEFDKLTTGQRAYAKIILRGKMPGPGNLARLQPGSVRTAITPAKVSQVIDDNNFIDAKAGVWFEGVPTSNLKDGVRVNLGKAVFYCEGNKTYPTAFGGSNTVMVVRKIRPDDVIDTIQPIAEARGYRIWGKGTGKLIMAKLVKATSRSVTVEFVSGKKKRFKKRNIASSDWKWVEEQNDIRN